MSLFWVRLPVAAVLSFEGRVDRCCESRNMAAEAVRVLSVLWRPARRGSLADPQLRGVPVANPALCCQTVTATVSVSHRECCGLCLLTTGACHRQRPGGMRWPASLDTGARRICRERMTEKALGHRHSPAEGIKARGGADCLVRKGRFN